MFIWLQTLVFYILFYFPVYIYINENVLYLCPLFTQGTHFSNIIYPGTPFINHFPRTPFIHNFSYVTLYSSFILGHPLFIIYPWTPFIHHLFFDTLYSWFIPEDPFLSFNLGHPLFIIFILELPLYSSFISGHPLFIIYPRTPLIYNLSQDTLYLSYLSWTSLYI